MRHGLLADLSCQNDIASCRTCKKGKGSWICISAPLWEARLWSAQAWITQFLGCKVHHTCLYLVKHSPDGATTNSDNSNLIAAYYSFIDPERIKGWVGLVSWPTADSLPIGYPSAAGPVHASESSPVRDRYSTTEPHCVLKHLDLADWLK